MATRQRPKNDDMGTVSLTWIVRRFNVDHKINEIIGELEDFDLSAAVYVIRLAGSFVIQYPKMTSPVLYIGQGHFRNRMSSHLKWIKSFHGNLRSAQFEVRFCCPKVKYIREVRKPIEAYLLHRFKNTYGMLPIRNKRIQNTYKVLTFSPQNALKTIFSVGRGNRPLWAVTPLRSNKWYGRYHENLRKTTVG